MKLFCNLVDPLSLCSMRYIVIVRETGGQDTYTYVILIIYLVLSQM